MILKCFNCESWVNEEDLHTTYSGWDVWSRECPCGSDNLVHYENYQDYLDWMARYHPDWEVLPEPEKER